MAKGFNKVPAMGGGQSGMMQQLQKLQKQMEARFNPVGIRERLLARQENGK